MTFVVDASVAAAWCLPDEVDHTAEAVLSRLEVEEALVPDLFWHELRNVMLAAERRNRLEPADVSEALAWLRQLPIAADGDGDDVRILDLARRYGLTAYDAAYLALAVNRRCMLATLDRRLIQAAAAEQVAVIKA